MPTLKEIKGRIASVRSTLKITSAMKLVSSAKLRKAQKAIESMRPYEQQLQEILASLVTPGTAPVMPGTAPVMPGSDRASRIADQVGNDGLGPVMPGPDRASSRPLAIVAIASNSSLCGGFNAAAIAKVRSVRRDGDVVYSIGRKMADVMRRDGFLSPCDFTDLAEHPSYAPAAALVEQLSADFEAGRIAGALLVYNHFCSTAKQVPVVEWLLGDSSTSLGMTEGAREASDPVILSERSESNVSLGADDTAMWSGTEVPPIIEPSRKELLALLLPKTLKLKLYSAILDSAAAEHAARTVAMQTATDNGENLLEELTLQYNKGRQQKITSEILDLAGGQMQQ